MLIEVLTVAVGNAGAGAKVHVALAASGGHIEALAFGRSLWLPEGAELGVNGMSGEPILDLRGRTIGVISTGPAANPHLMGNLSAWRMT
jgi:hypothetical protein